MMDRRSNFWGYFPISRSSPEIMTSLMAPSFQVVCQESKVGAIEESEETLNSMHFTDSSTKTSLCRCTVRRIRRVSSRFPRQELKFGNKAHLVLERVQTSRFFCSARSFFGATHNIWDRFVLQIRRASSSNRRAVSLIAVKRSR